MTLRQKFWITLVISAQSFLLVFWLTGVFLPHPHGDRINPAVGLAEIHELLVTARKENRVPGVAEIRGKIAELNQSPLTQADYYLIGNDANWTVVAGYVHQAPTTLDRLMSYYPDVRPVYVLTSSDDGFTIFEPDGKVRHMDFNWHTRPAR